MIQKLESDLNIVLLDRSGHRAKFTDTGLMMQEKGRAIALDTSFPFATQLPGIDAFNALNKQTRLNFTHHSLAGLAGRTDSQRGEYNSGCH